MSRDAPPSRLPQNTPHIIYGVSVFYHRRKGRSNLEEVIRKLIEAERNLAVFNVEKELTALKANIVILERALEDMEIKDAEQYVEDKKNNKYAFSNPCIETHEIRKIFGLKDSERVQAIFDAYERSLEDEKDEEEHHKVVMVNMKEE